MLRSEAQMALVCQALCASLGLGRLWTSAGPTDEAVALLEAGGGPLSSGERIVLLSAWAVWNGEGDAKLADVIHRLDSRRLHELGTLLVAVGRGGAAIDAWISSMNRAGNA